jgi:threonyl-tRNA synthetase
VEVDLRSEKIGRKIAESEQAKIPISLIIGQKEMDAESVSLRIHGKGDTGSKTITEIVEMFKQLDDPYFKAE